MTLTVSLSLLALAVALSLRPWRLLRGGALATPLLATLVVLPWLWALPRLHAMPLQLQWSGACLVTLTLGWPLAVPVLLVVAALSAWIAPLGWVEASDLLFWLGLVPSSLSLLIGAALRRWAGEHPFIYILGRGFLGTAVSVFAAGLLAQWSGHELAHVSTGLGLVARWLMAWGDAFMTGMLAAIFVAFRPQWLATWSDLLYLKKASQADPAIDKDQSPPGE
jgi:uncharacterized membrane protein